VKVRCSSESIEWLMQAIRRLPSDEPVPPGTHGYNEYTTQKEHWLGWLDPTAGRGTYPRQIGSNRDARDVYNHVVEPKLLAWLIGSAGVSTELVQAALREAESKTKLPSKSAAIRRHVPWEVVAAALKTRMSDSAA